MISDAIALVAKAIELTNQIRGIAERAKDAETKMAIADLQLSLADLKLELAKVKDENQSLQDELDRRQALPKIGDGIEIRGGVLYLTNKESDPKDPRAYCPRCFEVDKRLMLLSHIMPSANAMRRFECPQCESKYM